MSDAYGLNSEDGNGERADRTLATRPFSPPHRNNIQEDILAEIFYLLSRDPDFWWAGRIRNVWDWVRVTEVSRYWRRVAIGTANLWTYLDTSLFFSARRTVVFLRRSKDSDLTLFFDGSSDYIGNVKIALKYHMRRIRHLTVDATLDLENCEELSEVLNQSAPNAQSIMVRLMYCAPKPYIRLPTTSPGVLQSLDVCCINLSSSLASFSKLVSLFITDCINFSLGELFTVLEASPDLSLLSVVTCSIRDSSLSRTVYLRKLTFLELNCLKFSEIYNFILNIEVPNLEDWRCKCRESLASNDVAGLSIFSRLMDLQGEYLEWVRIEASTYRGAERLEMSTHKEPSMTDYKTRLRLYFESSIYLDVDDVMRRDNAVMQDAFRRLLVVYGNRITKAKELSVEDINDLLHVDDWRRVYRASECAEVVHASIMNGENYGTNCLIALGAHPPIHSGEKLWVPCPDLNYIDIRWSSHYSGSGSSFDAILSALEEVLRTRSVLGRAVHKVSFSSHGYMGEVDRIRGFDKFKEFSRWVEELDWVCKLTDLPE